MPQAEPESDRRRARIALVIVLALAVAMATGVASRGERQRRAGDIDSDVKPLAKVSDALAGGDVATATRAWNDAYGVALAASTWAAMADVGDAARRLADATPTRSPYEEKARQAYLISLFRARNEGSLDGVLRAAEAFAALGDRELVDHCRRIAEQLAAQPRHAVDVRSVTYP
jgi:hypothetical protein